MSKARSITALVFAALLSMTVCASASMSAIQSCRALDNQTYEIQSDNMVALGDGQYVISLCAEKQRQNFICTAHTLIRAGAARLIVQVSSHRTRIAVLSGSIIVKDLRERHIIELQPEAVYECALTDRTAFCSTGTAFEDIVDKTTTLPAFQTKQSQTTLYRISKGALNQSRLSCLVTTEEKIDRKSTLPPARLLSPPTVLNYEVGARFARYMPIPQSLVQHFPPSGIIVERVQQLVAETEPAN